MKYLLCLTLLPLLAYSAAVVNEVKSADVVAQKLTSDLIAHMRKEVQDRVLKKHVDEVVLKMKFRQAMMQQNPGFDFLCKPCKTVFTDVLQELESIEKITEPLLVQEIDVSFNWVVID